MTRRRTWGAICAAEENGTLVRKHLVSWQEYGADNSVGQLQRREFTSVEEAAVEGAAIFRKRSTFAAWLNGTPFTFVPVSGGIYVAP